jgi:putative ABC transport system permease protein
LNQSEFSGNRNQPNTILFDIQTDQKHDLAHLISEYKFSVNQFVPIVTCRLSAVKGKSVEVLRADSALDIPEWALTREYRVTYRDTLTDSEKLLSGKTQFFKSGPDSVHITISDDFRNTLKVDIGDTLVFDLQGLPVKTIIAGVRSVEWPKSPPNFIFVFPSGVMEQAPQTWVLSMRISENAQSASFQQNLVNRFPNVSMIDLKLVLSTVNAIFEKIGLVVRFLVFFSLLTGLIVMAGAVINSRFLRVKEYVLLRTLGSSAGQVLRITLIEYAYLGFFSALTGLILGFLSGYIVCVWFFRVDFSANYPQLALLTMSVVLISMLIGWFNSRSVLTVRTVESSRY